MVVGGECGKVWEDVGECVVGVGGCVVGVGGCVVCVGWCVAGVEGWNVRKNMKVETTSLRPPGEVYRTVPPHQATSWRRSGVSGPP